MNREIRPTRHMLIMRTLDEIEDERSSQNITWGGDKHDDQHSSHDWVAYITRHTGKAVMWPWASQTFRKQMVRVAALAVAAIEWCDRLEK